MARPGGALDLFRTHVHVRGPRAVVIRITAALALLAAPSPARAAEGAFAPTGVSADGGSTTAISHWQIQSSSKAPQGGAEVSSAGYSTREWYPVSGRPTVM